MDTLDGTFRNLIIALASRSGSPLEQRLAADLSMLDFAISKRAHASFEARSGSHDDLVLALALATYLGVSAAIR